jgi:hypothetical protein
MYFEFFPRPMSIALARTSGVKRWEYEEADEDEESVLLSELPETIRGAI